MEITKDGRNKVDLYGKVAACYGALATFCPSGSVDQKEAEIKQTEAKIEEIREKLRTESDPNVKGDLQAELDFHQNRWRSLEKDKDRLVAQQQGDQKIANFDLGGDVQLV